LDVDEVVVEGKQHAGVAVPQVVQGRVWCRKVGGCDGSAERAADDSAFQAGLVAGGEDEGVWGEAGTALSHECEQPAHQLGWDVDCAL
jgi:hypothetical protein